MRKQRVLTGTASFGFALAVFLVLMPGKPLVAQAKPVEIKLAIIPPAGSTWGDYVTDFSRQVREQTNGRVKVIVYAGGVMGDETDVVRKLRLGQLEAAGLTGFGLGLIVPEIRVLELPLLMGNYRESIYVTEKLTDHFASAFEKKGFVLYGWAPLGPVYFFSLNRLVKIEDAKGQKVWIWAGDPVAEAISQALGAVTPVPLAVVEVLQSLQTGLVNTFYAPPLGAVALQWYRHVKHVLDTPFAFGSGGVVGSKKILDSLLPQDQALIRKLVRELSGRLVDQVAQENDVALKGLVRAGIQFNKPNPDDYRNFADTMEKVYASLSGKLYPPSLLDRVRALIREYRKSQL